MSTLAILLFLMVLAWASFRVFAMKADPLYLVADLIGGMILGLALHLAGVGFL